MKRHAGRCSVRAAQKSLVGLGAIVLGILALVNVGGTAVMWTLNLVALLSVGGMIVLTGAVIGGRMLSALGGSR